MKNPFKYLQQDLSVKNEEYKKLVMKTYMIVFRLIFTGGFPFLVKGLFFALIGKKREQYKAFTHGSKVWGNEVIEYTQTRLYYSNQINVPETGHMVFLNHVNELDFPFDCCVINKPYLANQVIKSSIFAYWWMKAMGSQVFDTSHQRTIATSVHNLVAGLKDYSYIVYPEGHNSYSEEIKPLKKGMIKVAFDNKIPIYVVVKSGVQALQLKPKGNKIGYRACGTFYPQDYSSWEELRDVIYSTMVSEKRILDAEIKN
ncbi:MAG: 1-acyl-sn-glycerol-3-phosphate acyltransferase [Leptospiraceae bacterium]|nr:1-acyl-sn-glycerol-3-phosphate acyltransferase [Leptospiraceae bacterium]